MLYAIDGAREPILAAVGDLQLDVTATRLKTEYGGDADVQRLSYEMARCVNGAPTSARASPGQPATPCAPRTGMGGWWPCSAPNGYGGTWRRRTRGRCSGRWGEAIWAALSQNSALLDNGRYRPELIALHSTRHRMSDDRSTEPAEEPVLTLAAFFEAVIREDSGVLTLVRMIDRITISIMDAWVSSLPPSHVEANLVVSFRGQELQGSGVVSIHPRKPSGDRLPKQDIPFVFETHTGVNLNIQLGMVVDEEGYYWFDILLNDEFVTKTPLQIVFARAKKPDSENSGG